MLNQKIIAAMNEQINSELFSSYLYVDMANFYGEKHLYGFQHWFMKQASEEAEHAEKFIDFLVKNAAHVELKPVNGETRAYKDLREPLTIQLAHEQKVTSLIEKIYDLADEFKDRRVAHFLDWFINEQSEEEATAFTLIDRYDRLAIDSKGLAMLDEELGKR